MTAVFETESAVNLNELERLAWASGDTEKAAHLAALADAVPALEKLREMYWTLRECFPIESSTKKAELLENLQHIWDTLKEYEEHAE